MILSQDLLSFLERAIAPISVGLWIVQVVAFVWARRISGQLVGRDGRELADIITGVTFALVIAQALTVAKAVLIGLDPVGSIPLQVVLFAARDFFVTIVCVTALVRIRRIA